MLLRNFITQSKKPLTHLLSSRAQIDIKDITSTDFQDIQKLSLPNIRKISYIFFKNYEHTTECKEFSEKFQNLLIKILPNIDDLNKSLILKNLGFGIEKKVSLSTELLQTLVLPGPISKNPSLKYSPILGLVKFLPLFQDKNIQYETYLKSYFSKIALEELEKISASELINLCIILYKIGTLNKYFDILVENKEGIYVVLERIIKKKMDDLSVRDAFNILKCFVVNDRGSEDFCRKLESMVFSNLSGLLSKEVSDIPNIYAKRKLHNYSYLINSIYKPLYEEIVKRFDEMDSFTLSACLFNYWRNSNLYGIYCTGELVRKLKDLLRNTEYFNGINSVTASFLIQNVLSLLSHIRKIDQNVIDSVIQLEKIFSQKLDPMFYMRVINYMSRYEFFDELMLENFLSRFEQLYEDRKNFKSLYLIWLNFKLKIPEHFGKLRKTFTDARLDEIESEWKKSKTNYLDLSEASQIHQEFKRELEILKVEYVFEYYDEYFIDLALPKYRICIEIHGPGHYIFPDNQINGKTQNKMEILEKLGWKYYSYPYFLHKYRKNTIGIFLNKIIPLDFH